MYVPPSGRNRELIDEEVFGANVGLGRSLSGIVYHDPYLGVQMVHEILHQLFQWHYIHEILHLLSGCVGSFLGTWVYFLTFQRRRIGGEP
jgi:hypothetical protein